MCDDRADILCDSHLSLELFGLHDIQLVVFLDAMAAAAPFFLSREIVQILRFHDMN